MVALRGRSGGGGQGGDVTHERSKFLEKGGRGERLEGQG